MSQSTYTHIYVPPPNPVSHGDSAPPWDPTAPWDSFPSWDPAPPPDPPSAGRLNIQAEISPAQIDVLDKTNRIQFTKNRKDLIGEGSFGQVYRGQYQRSNGEWMPVAIKILMHALGSSKETERVTQRFMREIVTWKRVSQHENIADLLGIYRTDHDPPYLVLPYYGNNKLLAYLAQSHPDMRLILAKEIARGVDVLHGNGVIHGDLKPENIFVSDDGHAKIADFGVSVIPQLAGFTTTSMNPKNVRYSAPELLPLTDINPPMPTRQSDIFSLGILFMQLFDGRVDCLPYNHVPKNVNDGGDTNLLKRIHKPKSDRPRREDHPNISKSRWNVIAACWAADPSARPSIRRVRAWLGQV